jgi:arsenical-resistance protein 2
MSAAETPAPWYTAFPAPTNQTPTTIPRDEVLALIKQAESRKNYVLIDVRRNDHEGGTIRSSINLPAQSLYHSIPALYSLFKAAGIERVIWYCGSCNGRGPRAAGWFDDYVKSQGNATMTSLVLVGGIKGWVKAGPEYVELMDGYVADVWAKKSAAD